MLPQVVGVVELRQNFIGIIINKLQCQMQVLNGGKGACNNDKTFRFLIKDLYFSRNSNKFTDCIYRTFIFSWKRLMLGFQENQLSTGIPRNFSLPLPLSLSIHGSHYNVYVLPLRSCDART